MDGENLSNIKEEKGVQCREANTSSDTSPLESKEIISSFKNRNKLPKKKRKKHANYDALAECRRMFRLEMVQLGKELQQFRQMCQTEISKYPNIVKDHADRHQKENNEKQTYEDKPGETSVEEYWKTKLDNLQADMTYLEKKQAQLDREQQLIDKEDELSEKLINLENYEQQIAELEMVLDKRQDRCAKRQQDLFSLEEELQQARADIEQERADIENGQEKLEEGEDQENASSRARKHWDIVRKNMLEKQTVLESTVQKYRAELASASSNITGKDILINKLDEQVKLLHEEIANKDKKIKNLESRLIMTINESRKVKVTKQIDCDYMPYRSSDSPDSSPTHNSRVRPDSQNSFSDISMSKSNNSLWMNSLAKNKSNSSTPNQRGNGHVRHYGSSLGTEKDDRFQLGLRSPLPEKSSACLVM